MKINASLISLGFFALLSFASFAKPFVITGKIIDKNGEPVPFASIKILGTKMGVSADALGDFRLKIKNEKVVLEISAASAETVRILVGTQRYFVIALELKKGIGIVYIHSAPTDQYPIPQKIIRTITNIDSMKVIRDSIYNLKSNYIGQPLSKLMADLGVSVTFSYSGNKMNEKNRQGKCKKIILSLPLQTGFQIWSYKIVLTNKVYVDFEQAKVIGQNAWNMEMKKILEQQILSSIKNGNENKK